MALPSHIWPILDYDICREFTTNHTVIIRFSYYPIFVLIPLHCFDLGTVSFWYFLAFARVRGCLFGFGTIRFSDCSVLGLFDCWCAVFGFRIVEAVYGRFRGLGGNWCVSTFPDSCRFSLHIGTIGSLWSLLFSYYYFFFVGSCGRSRAYGSRVGGLIVLVCRGFVVSSMIFTIYLQLANCVSLQGFLNSALRFPCKLA